MKIIVAGRPKTGTKSICKALKLLGYDVYDWLENYWFLNKDWTKQFEEGIRVEDLQRMLKEVDAVTDSPGDIFCEELLEAFPNAKVILSTRNEDDWYESIVNQFKIVNNDYFVFLAQMLTYTGWKAHRYRSYMGQHLGTSSRWPRSYFTIFCEEHLKRQYRKHNKNVERNTPEGQLLVFQVAEGWDPLCKFLDVPIPDIPFPHENKKASLVDDLRVENAIMRQIEREFKLSLAILACLIGFCVFKIVQWIYL